MIITKLLILLIISIVTSQFALIFYLTVFSRIYGVDCCINVYCMYLSFGFTGNIWKKLFCGKQCLSCSFPWIKMWAFTCFVSWRRKKTLDLDEKPHRECICECTAPIYNDNQRRLRKLCQSEYNLYIAQ